MKALRLRVKEDVEKLEKKMRALASKVVSAAICAVIFVNQLRAMIWLCGRDMLAGIPFFTVFGRPGTRVRVMTKRTRSLLAMQFVARSITLKSITYLSCALPQTATDKARAKFS